MRILGRLGAHLRPSLRSTFYSVDSSTVEVLAFGGELPKDATPPGLVLPQEPQ